MLKNLDDIKIIMDKYFQVPLTKDEVKELIMYDPSQDIDTLFDLLDEVIQRKYGSFLFIIGHLIHICDAWTNEKDVYYMNKLVADDWHNMQEDYAMELGSIRDPSSVPYLIKAATLIVPHLETWGGNPALHRKCLYSLAKIGTPEAIQAIFELRKHEYEDVRDFAEEVIELYELTLPGSNEEHR